MFLLTTYNIYHKSHCISHKIFWNFWWEVLISFKLVLIFPQQFHHRHFATEIFISTAQLSAKFVIDILYTEFFTVA